MADDWGSGATTEEQDFAMDTSGYSKEDLGGDGGLIEKEGWYHLEITDVVKDLNTLNDKGKERSPCVRFDMLVLQTVEGQSPEGSRHFHKVYMAAKGGAAPAEGSVKSAMRFGLGLGLLKTVTRDDGSEMIVDAATGKPSVTSSLWLKAKGMQLIAKVKFKKGDKNFSDSYEIPFGRVYQVDDPAVAEVPKNLEAIAMIGKTVEAPPAKGGTGGKSTGPAPGGQGGGNSTPPASAPSPDDDFSDL